MAIAHNEIDFELSGGVGNTDPEASWGDDKSGTSIHEFEGTLTANQPDDRSLFIDSGRMGDGDDVHVDKFVLFVGGAANLSAHRIIGFRSSDGLFTLEGRTSAAALSGDFYRVFELGSMWHEVSSAECANGHTDYTMLYVQNDSANDGTEVSFYLYRLTPTTGWAGIEFQIVARQNANQNESPPPNHQTGPTESTLRSFTQPATLLDINRQPQATTPLNLANGQFRSCWFRRIISANARRNPYCVLMLVHEFTDDAAAQIRVGCLLPFGLLGYTPLTTISHDRGPGLTEGQARQPYDAAIYVGGGARFTAEVRSEESGLIVPGQEIGWSETGDGSLFVPALSITDDDGLAAVTYHAPLPGVLANETIAFGSTSVPTGNVETLNDSDSIKWDHTIASGDDRLLIVAVNTGSVTESAAEAPEYRRSVSAIVNGAEMTRIGYMRLGSIMSECFYLTSPPVGLVNVKVTFAGVGSRVGAASVYWTGVDVVNPIDVAPIFESHDEDAGTTISQTITTVTDNALLVHLYSGWYPGDLFTIEGAGQSDRGVLITGADLSNVGTLSDKPAPTAGIFTMSRSSLAAGQDRLNMTFALRAARASATVTARV